MSAIFERSTAKRDSTAERLKQMEEINAPVLNLVKNLNKIDQLAKRLNVFIDLEALGYSWPEDLDIEAPFKRYIRENNYKADDVLKQSELWDVENNKLTGIEYHYGERLVCSLRSILTLDRRLEYQWHTFDSRQRSSIAFFDHDGRWKSTTFKKGDEFRAALCADSADSLTLVQHDYNVADDALVSRRFNRSGNCQMVEVEYPTWEDLYNPTMAEYVSRQHPEDHPKITFEHQLDGFVYGEYCISGGISAANVVLDSKFKIISKQIHDLKRGY